MEELLLTRSYLKNVIAEIKSEENIQRKVVSYKKTRMQNDDFWHYVEEELKRKLQQNTVDEMHIFANVNLQKRVSRSEAAIYRSAPERTMFLGDKESDELFDIYEEMDINTVMRKANIAFKYLNQCAIQIVPQKNQLKAKLLLPHHYDVIPDPENPEQAMAYIISNFDNSIRDKVRKDGKYEGHSQGDTFRNQTNEKIADPDDVKKSKERYYVWSKSFNFVADGNGKILDKEDHSIAYADNSFINEDGLPILDENILSPLFELECLPFIDIADQKDFEFWVRGDEALFDATVMYNTILTKEFQVVELQGHSQAVYKGHPDHMPSELRIGADKVIFIPQDPETQQQSSFEFVNPNSDLGNIREFRESYLASFLSSRGLDVSLVSGKSSVNKASSGVEKMLQMIEKFEASQEDFSLFKRVEYEAFKIISCWIKSLYAERVSGELILDEVYQIKLPDLDKMNLTIEYEKPELIKSEKEILEITEKEINLGVSSRVHYLMEHKGMTKEQAIERIKEIEEFESIEGQDEERDQQEQNTTDV